MDIWFTLFAIGTSLLLAGGGTLLLVGYIGTLPAALSFGWRIWVPTLLLPVAGPAWFALKQGAEFRRAFYQLTAGTALICAAAGVLLGYGPYFAEKIVAEMVEMAKTR